MIIVFAPERTGTTSVNRLFHGSERTSRHFVSDRHNRPRGSMFVSRDNVLTRKASGEVELVILMIRDPIARVVSECFHRVKEGELDACPDGDDLSTWVLAVGDHSAMLDHAIYEVPAVGVDILRIPFKPPVTVYKTAPTVMACRLRDLDKLPDALRDNGFPMFGRGVTRENVGKYPVLKFPKYYVDRMMDNAYTRHFYNDTEIAEMRLKWSVA